MLFANSNFLLQPHISISFEHLKDNGWENNKTPFIGFVATAANTNSYIKMNFVN